MIINTTRFGEIDIPEEELLNFPQGLPGFPERKSYALLPYKPESPFAFLQSADEPDLAFILADPFAFIKDYEFELDDGVAREFGFSKDAPPQVFNIVTVPENAEEMTANLVAPIVVNLRDRTAIQIVLEKTAYTTRHRLFPQGWPKGGK